MLPTSNLRLRWLVIVPVLDIYLRNLVFTLTPVSCGSACLQQLGRGRRDSDPNLCFRFLVLEKKCNLHEGGNMKGRNSWLGRLDSNQHRPH